MNEQVALERHKQLLDAVLGDPRDQELRALLGAAWIDEQQSWRNLTHRLAEQWKSEGA
jgi:hypothetical protein